MIHKSVEGDLIFCGSLQSYTTVKKYSDALICVKKYQNLGKIAGTVKQMKNVEPKCTCVLHRQTLVLENVNLLKILWCIEPLLGKDLETNNEYSCCYATVE
jgi:hypothetical protein